MSTTTSNTPDATIADKRHATLAAVVDHHDAAVRELYDHGVDPPRLR